MGRYSSDSESSRSSRARKSKKSSRRSSSRSASPKKCKKKLKKYKRSYRSSSRDTKSRHSSESKSKYRHRSRSSERRKKRSSSRDSERRRKDDHRKSKHSKSKRRHRSSSSSQSSRSTSSSSTRKSRSKSPPSKRKFDYDPDELLEKLNKAAVEAMAANKKLKPDPLSSIEMQIKRHDMINELRVSGSTGIVASSSDSMFISATPGIPPLPLLSTKLADKLPSEDPPVIVDLNSVSFNSKAPSAESSNPDSLLHPNFFLENQEDKLNRWVKKLFLFRQRAISGELLSV